MALRRSRDFPETEFEQEEQRTSGEPPPVSAQDGSLLTVDALARFQHRWNDVQERFVVKPGDAAIEAEDLIQDIGEALAASTVRRRTDLNQVSTMSIRFLEQLWITLQRCRLLMNAIQAPRR